jgi:hypothetical protein
MSTANTPPQDIILEHLKRIQGDLADLKRDNRDLKASNAMILGMVGDLVKAAARSDERFANVEVRIERIEHRLDLQDHPPA